MLPPRFKMSFFFFFEKCFGGILYWFRVVVLSLTGPDIMRCNKITNETNMEVMTDTNAAAQSEIIAVHSAFLWFSRVSFKFSSIDTKTFSSNVTSIMGKCKFRDHWLEKSEFRGWLKPIKNDDFKAHCT